MTLATLDRNAIRSMVTSLKSNIQEHSVEKVAQGYGSTLYNALKPDVLLMRVFITTPYANLSSDKKAKCDALAAKRGLSEAVQEQTASNRPLLRRR